MVTKATASGGLPLAGKVALVTGGSRGIGAAIALKLAEQGADVALTYGNNGAAAETVVAAIGALGRTARAYKADARKPAEAAAVLAGIAKEWGGLDILVNNAGVFELTGIEDGAANAAYDSTFAVNVESVFKGTQAVAGRIRDGGRIVNISSVMGLAAMMPAASVYAASKFAVMGLTKGWAHDLAPRKITVNAVQPGPIDTDMNPDSGGEFSEQMKQSLPLKRYGKPEEIAALVAFLAGPEAAFITGAEVNISGGALI